MSHAPEGVSRRRVLAAAGGLATLAALPACSVKPKHSNVPLHKRAAGAGADAQLLIGLLAIERYAAAAYAAAAPLLSPQAKHAAKQFLGQELSHAGELEGLIRQAGSLPPAPPASYDLGHPRTEAELLALLHRAEQAQLRAYLTAIPQLTPARLRAALAAILANEAQHTAVLRQQLGLDPVPGPLVSAGE